MKTIICLLLFSLHLVYGQENISDRSSAYSKNQNLTITGFSYPIFLNEEKHASFLVNYPLSNQLHMELQGFYDTYLVSNRFRLNLSLKQYLTEKLYVIGGVEIEAGDYKQILPSQPPRIGAVMGFGYDVLNNFAIEGKFNAQLNNSLMGAYGEPFVRMPQVYTIGGKVKF